MVWQKRNKLRYTFKQTEWQKKQSTKVKLKKEATKQCDQKNSQMSLKVAQKWFH